MVGRSLSDAKPKPVSGTIPRGRQERSTKSPEIVLEEAKNKVAGIEAVLAALSSVGATEGPEVPLQKSKRASQEPPIAVQVSQTGAFVERARKRLAAHDVEREALVNELEASPGGSRTECSITSTSFRSGFRNRSIESQVGFDGGGARCPRTTSRKRSSADAHMQGSGGVGPLDAPLPLGVARSRGVWRPFESVGADFHVVRRGGVVVRAHRNHDAMRPPIVVRDHQRQTWVAAGPRRRGIQPRTSTTLAEMQRRGWTQCCAKDRSELEADPGGQR